MAFNGRASMAYNMQPSVSSRQEQDPFMISDKEIAECITDIGMPFTLDDLRKPQPHDIQRLFEYFASVLLNLTRDVVAPAMRVAAEESSGSESDRLFSPDSRDLMGLFVMLRRLMLECSITDFSLNDLYKPTYPRLQRILSYVINFVRFRESQTSIVDKHFEEAERTKLHVQQLYADKDRLEAKLAHLQRDRAATDKANKAKEAELADLKPRLLDLDRKKSRLVTDLARAEAEKKRLIAHLDDRTTALDTARTAAATLRPYTLQRPDALESTLRDLSAGLASDRATADALDRRARALATSREAFAAVAADVAATHRLLADLSADLAREDDEVAAAARCRDALGERSTAVQDVERTERLMRKQLEAVVGRTDKVRGLAAERNGDAAKKMEELRGLHTELSRERGEKTREIERMRVRIEATEKKMADTKASLEAEIETARQEYMKMDSHIRLYIDEMGQYVTV